jgi:hypothetical protein
VTPKRQELLDYWMDHGGFPDEVSPPLFGDADGDPLDEAVIGMTELAPAGSRGWRPAWVYNGRKLRAVLLETGTADDEVDEHISYNIEGSMTADGPVIVWPLMSDESAPG